MYGIGYTHPNASFITAGGGDGWGQYIAADGDARIWFGASADAKSYFNAGNVGIGTTGPRGKLDVNGHIVLERTKNIEWHWGTNGRRQYIEGTAGNQLGIFAGSGIGIGTNSPQASYMSTVNI